MKSTAGAHPLRRFTLDSNDWELDASSSDDASLESWEAMGRTPSLHRDTRT